MMRETQPPTESPANLDLSEIEEPVLVRLHSLENPASPKFAALELPGLVGRCGGENPRALCIAPGEWLLVGAAAVPAGQAAALAERLRRQLASDLTAVCDQSDGLAGIRVAGPAAPWLLGKLSCLDFAGVLGPGAYCARTRMGEAAVIVHSHAVTGDPPAAPVFDLYVDRSIAQALWNLLTASAPHAAELFEDFGAFA